MVKLKNLWSFFFKKKEIQQGTWLGGEPALTPEQSKKFKLDEKLSEFGYNYLRKLFPSVDLVYAFLRMQAMTMPTTKALNSKRLIVQEITLKKYLKGIEDLRVVYVGSAVDIEYPLLLGARKITMVDPSYTKRMFNT